MTRLDRIAPLFQKLIAVFLVIGAGYAAEKGADGGFLKDVWVALKTASPPVAMVMFMLFLDERRERRDCQKQLNERTVDFIQSTNQSDRVFGRAIDRLTDARHSRRRRG